MPKGEKVPAVQAQSSVTTQHRTGYDMVSPEDTLQLATDLTKYIRDQKLFMNIQGREYVNVEGWQFAGSRLGLVPVVTTLENISTNEELKYQAKVDLINLRNDQKVGCGFAICSNKEPGKRGYQEFAIASMAQTRAVGKAYRNILAWVIKAAGYEATPAEEMEYQGNTPATSAQSTAQQAIAAEEDADIKTATAKQKAEIIKLLNHPTITMDEKNKMLMNINRFDEDRAGQAIAKLKKSIEDRTAKVNIASDDRATITPEYATKAQRKQLNDWADDERTQMDALDRQNLRTEAADPNLTQTRADVMLRNLAEAHGK
jgi:hypothetical protein